MAGDGIEKDYTLEIVIVVILVLVILAAFIGYNMLFGEKAEVITNVAGGF